MLSKHGVDEAAVQKAMAEMGGAKPPDDAKMMEVMNSLAAPIKDGVAFVDEAVKVLQASAPSGPGGPQMDFMPKDLVVKDVKVDGDKAVAKVSSTQNGKEETKDLTLVRVGGAWKIDLVPLLQASMKAKKEG